MKWLCLTLVVIGLTGCANMALRKPIQQWNGWLGQHKDERVRELGIPRQCTSLRSGEVCEWGVEGGTVTMNFDEQGIACEWTYRGFYGERRSEKTCRP
jgi:hypothetical protein